MLFIRTQTPRSIPAKRGDCMLKKKDLVERLALRGYTKAAAGQFIDDFIMVVSEALVNGESVLLFGFGLFEVVTREERSHTDVDTGKSRVVPRHRLPKFVPGTTLKRFVEAGKFF